MTVSVRTGGSDGVFRSWTELQGKEVRTKLGFVRGGGLLLAPPSSTFEGSVNVILVYVLVLSR